MLPIVEIQPIFSERIIFFAAKDTSSKDFNIRIIVCCALHSLLFTTHTHCLLSLVEGAMENVHLSKQRIVYKKLNCLCDIESKAP